MKKPTTAVCANCKHCTYLRSQLGYTPICSRRSNIRKGRICVITFDVTTDRCKHWSDSHE